MKKLLLILSLVIFITSCKFFPKKKMYSNGLDSILEMADSLNGLPDDVESKLNDIESEDNLSMDSLKGMYMNGDLGSEKMFMIVGSFLVPQNAENYAQTLTRKGYSTAIITNSSGFNMVSVQAYSSLRDGINDLETYRQNICPKAWIYIKR